MFLLIFLALFSTTVQAQSLDSYKQSSLTKMEIEQESIMPILNKHKKSKGTIWIKPGLLKWETQGEDQRTTYIEKNQITIVIKEKKKNTVLKGETEPNTLSSFLQNLDSSKCKSKENTLTCDSLIILVEAGEIKSLEYKDDTDNKILIKVNKTIFNSKEKVSFSYKIKKTDEVIDLPSLKED